MSMSGLTKGKPAKVDDKIKIEPRGKYPGVKIHLNGPQTEVLLGVKLLSGKPAGVKSDAHKLLTRVVKAIQAAYEEDPDLLKERTPEQVQAELELELKKSIEKLGKMEKGEEWNG